VNLTQPLLVTTTCPSQDSARTLAHLIVESRLGGCVQMVPISSTYRWHDEVCVEDEFQLTIKTTMANTEPLQQLVTDHLAAEIPEFVITPIVGGSTPYLSWLRDATRKE
jgi:periplasmic divalent cation tolerance protein